MTPAKIIASWACTVLLLSHTPQLKAAPSESLGTKLIQQLAQAEISHDADSIRRLFAIDAVIYVPDNMPFAGNDAITSLFEYAWQNTANKTVNYQVERTETNGQHLIVHGTNTSVSKDGDERTSNFMAVIKQASSNPVMAQLSYAGAKTVTPTLPAPTGEYAIGQARFFYPADAGEDGRVIAFQVWYPAAASDSEFLRQHTIETTSTSAEFLGLPPFLFSFGSIVRSNSVLDAQAVPGKSFPVVIYNHGYSGFTAVYQTMFEELASHGYVVVSVGHENESSLFIKPDGTIARTNPENAFYTSRGPELEGSRINALQSTILNSDDTTEVVSAYQRLVRLSPLHNESTRLWAADTLQVLNKLKELNNTDDRIMGILDLDVVGVMGHSVGGATAGQLAFGHDRIKAGINLDGFQFGDLVSNRIEVPFMFVSSNQVGDTYLRASNFMDRAEADCYLAVLTGFTHGSFTDLTYFQQGGQASIALQRDLVRNFFDKYLKKLNLDLEVLAERYPEMTIHEHLK